MECALPDHPALQELKSLPQWVAWNYEERRGKRTKVPIDPQTGGYAKSNVPDTWSDYEQAHNCANTHKLPGTGFMLGSAGYIGYDLDDCRNPKTGFIKPWAREIIELKETYAEVSPSGTGIRLIARGETEKSFSQRQSCVEVYRDGRYLTITGQHIAGTPDSINPAPRTLAACKERVRRHSAVWSRLGPMWKAIAEGRRLPPHQGNGHAEHRDYRHQRVEDDRIEDALRFINADDRDVWLKMGMALHHHLGESGHPIWNRWSRSSQKYDAEDLDRVWRSFKGSGITINSLFSLARQAGWTPEREPLQPHEKKRFALVPFHELLPGAASPYLVKALIPRNGLVAVWGPPKCGKSFWAFDLALHPALGWDYRGRHTLRGPTVYCAFEGAEGYKARAAAFRKAHHIEAEQVIPFYLVPVRIDLVKDHAALIASIRERLEGELPVSVTLDTLNRSLAGSESSDEDMTAYLNAADAIAEAFYCVVIIIHHCGVDGSRPRGHTSLTGTVVAQLAVKRDAANNIVVTVEWMKDGPEGEVIASSLEVVGVGTDEDGEPITSCVVRPSEAIAGTGGRRATGAAKVAFDLLVKAITECGTIPPASNHIPASTRTCRTSEWRQYCYAGMVTESANPDTRQKAFVRVSKHLQALGLIGVWNDNVWVAGHAGHSRT